MPKLKDEKETLLQEVSKLKKRISKLERDLIEHTQESSTEIMVREADGSWGEWTGAFQVTDKDKLDFALLKAEEHLEKYFNNGYKDKEFAIFQRVGNKRSIYKIIPKSSQ